MSTAAEVLAKFATELDFSDIPPPVVERAKDCIINTVGISAFGAQMPWSRMIADYARSNGNGGPCSLIGIPDARVYPPYAALANGLFAHGFELDNATEPSIGAHPGASIVPAMLAACEETGADGKTAITAFVAGCEVLCKIAVAAHHSRTPIESVGFHAPGVTGPYAAATAAACVYGFDAAQLTNALGIAGSLSSGILAFTKSKKGGMIKRVHLGRASESGILATKLARSGYEGPETVLEGKFGFLDVFCREGDPQLLTKGLGKEWDTLRIVIKRYPFHMSAHTAVQALRELMSEHDFSGSQVAGITVEGASKTVSHNNIAEPGDITQAQYSVPFCVALALFRDPDDPKSIDASALADPAIRSACRNVELRPYGDGKVSNKTVRLTVRLKDGRRFVREAKSFKGMPTDPLSRADLRYKFMLQTTALGERDAGALFERLENLEQQPRFAMT
jgi:2-methylcitrate dehydratase PrpD